MEGWGEGNLPRKQPIAMQDGARGIENLGNLEKDDEGNYQACSTGVLEIVKNTVSLNSFPFIVTISLLKRKKCHNGFS